jgi:hypothetical protein
MEISMSPVRIRARSSRISGAIGIGLAVLGGLLGGAPPANAAPPFAACPQVMPLPEVTDGMRATGLTVSSGTRPEPFSAKVLGILDNGIAPDVDMILVETDSPAIDRVDGIWQGMSGSPVYGPDGRWVGAVSYGLSLGPSKIAGLTPAGAMAEVLRGRPASHGPRTHVALPQALQERIAGTGAATSSQAAAGMTQLPMPLSVSGLSERRLGQVARQIPGGGKLYRGSGGVTGSAAPAQIKPGGNFGAAVSRGDVTLAGIGTTTVVCGELALAFGHPFLYTGPSSYSAHPGSAIAIADDPTFPPYKIANLGGVAGTVDRDRLTAVRARLGVHPVPINVTSSVRDIGTGASRTGSTLVNDPDYLAQVAGFHLLSNLDRVLGRVGAGEISLSWTATGTARGRRWSATRANRFADLVDVSYPAVQELVADLAAIHGNPFSPVRITAVRITAQAVSRYLAYRLDKAEVKNASGQWVTADGTEPIEVAADRPVEARARAVAYRGLAAPRTVTFTLPLPAGSAGRSGIVAIAGGITCQPSGSDSSPACLPSSPDSFSELLRALSTAPRNDDVIAALFLGEAPADRPVATRRARLTSVVSGQITLPVLVRR